MNRTEAIIILEGFKDNPLFNSTHAQALDMAISALSEQKSLKERMEQLSNGEVIQALFPNVSVYEHGSTYSVNNEYNFNSTWWNAPYQKGGEE